ncbi:MAG: DUF5715 family protein [Acidobacteriaceae bacterium]
MRKSTFKLTAVCRPEFRFAGIVGLAVLLLVSVSGLAASTSSAASRKRRVAKHATVRHSARRATTPSHGRRVNVSHPVARHASTRHAAAHRSTSHVRRVAQHRHGTRASIRRRRHSVEVALDNVRTHAALDAESTTGRAVDDEPASPLQSSAPALTAVADPGGSQMPVASPNTSSTAAADNTLFFDASIPHFMPLPLRGSHEVLVHQNIVADVEGLSRIQNDAQLSAMVGSGDLVALPASSALEIDPRLPYNRRYCRPWTAKFLRDLSSAHDSIFGHPLQLTSAVRTIDFQRHLEHYNGNAAPAYGDTASPHLTGQAIDLGKKGMSLREIAWMREVLGRLQAAGKLDVEEEFEQACFHISVYRTYTQHGAAPTQLIAKNEVAGPTEPSGAVVAVATRSVESIPASYPAHASAPVRRAVSYRHTRSYYFHHARRVDVRRRRRRHHRSMSLLAAGLR